MFQGDNPKKYWNLVSDIVTYDGFRDWYLARGCRGKLFWTVIMMGSVAAIGYYTVTVTHQFQMRPSATQLNEIVQSYVPFPNVTICHSARFNKSYIIDKIYIPDMYYPMLHDTPERVQEAFISYLAYLAYQPEPRPAPGVDEDVETMFQYYFNNSVNGDAYDLEQFLLDSSFECSQFLELCIFSSRIFDCCENAEKIFTDYGTCYLVKFEGESGTQMQSVPGFMGGLMINVRVNRSEIPTFNNNDRGLRVHLNDQMTIYDNPVFVPPNKHALIRVESTQYRFDPLIDDCAVDMPVLKYSAYSHDACSAECLLNITRSSCGCAPMGYNSSIKPDPICTPRVMGECVLPIMIGQGVNAGDTFQEQMSCVATKCPKMCGQRMYTTYASYLDLVRSPYSEEPSEIEMYALTAFYGEILYTSIQSAPLWDFNTFICNLGGMYGLWTGASVITLVQILYYCLLIPICHPGE